MQLAYLSGNKDDATFTVGGIKYILHDGDYLEVDIADGTNISASVLLVPTLLAGSGL